MNSEESFLKIKIFYKEKSLVIKSKDLITLKEIKEKSIKYFKINTPFKYLVNFFVKDNENGNNDKIYISSDDDIIKNSIEKDPQNLIIELVLIFENDKEAKTNLMNKDKNKNNKSIIGNNIKNEKEKNLFQIICNKHICIEGNMMKINELNKEINKYKDNNLNLKKQIQILKNGLENDKKKIKKLEEENLKLKEKIYNSNINFKLVMKKKTDYIKELEEEIKKYENSKDINIDIKNKTIKKLIKEEKVIDINIQNSLEQSNSNEQKLNSLNSIYEPALIPIKKESSPILQNKGDSNYNNKNDLNPLNIIGKGILEMELDLNDNLNNINIEEFINKNDKKRKYLSRNEEIKKEISVPNLNPKIEIKRKRTKKEFNIDEKKLDIDIINKIRKQCGDQVKDYSDEKIQKILDENGGNYMDTISDIMLRYSRIANQ